MYKQTIGSKINDFFTIEAERITKIDSKLEVIKVNIKKIQDQIKESEDNYVKCDLEENMSGKEKYAKNIDSLKKELQNLEGQCTIYERAKSKDGEMRKRAIQIQKDASKEIKKIYELINNKRLEVKKLEDEKAALEKRIEDTEWDLKSFEGLPMLVAQEIDRIQEYIYGEGVLDEKYQTERGFNKDRFILADLIKDDKQIQTLEEDNNNVSKPFNKVSHIISSVVAKVTPREANDNIYRYPEITNQNVESINDNEE
jgi:chromosome segregation ATPase